MKDIVDAMNNNNYEQLISIIFITIFVWLFNQFRISYIKRKEENKNDTKLALEKYSNLFHSINLFQLEEIDLKQLFISFDQTIYYLPRKTSTEIIEISRETLDTNNSQLETIKLDIEDKIKYLKFGQGSITSHNSDDNIMYRIEGFFYKYSFDSLLFSFISSISVLLAIVLLMALSFEIMQLNGYKRFSAILNLFNSFSTFLITINIVDLWVRKSLKTDTLLWYLLLILIPLILIISVLHYPIINTITIIIFFILIFKKDLMEAHIN